MSATVLPGRPVTAGRSRLDAPARHALTAAARTWFAVTVSGQWIFAAYIVALYGGSAVRGDFGAWNKVLPHGHEPGNAAGNLALGAHLLFAAILSVGGPLQLVPLVRARFPVFHRWLGRVYVPTAFVAGLSGLYLSLSGRKVVGDLSQHVAIVVNGLLILACAAMAFRTAVARDFRAHERWALRLFLVVSGVWFFRVGLMFWLAVNGGPAGFDPGTFRGPFLTFLAFAQYLLPLAVLEAYLRARDRGTAAARLAVGAALLLASAAMALGLFVAARVLWLPRL
ncbi:MAG: DUF2306 domain-containing protein [Vicinamibacteria bacterium]